MIIALQTLLFFRETFITVIERFLGQYYRKLSLKFKGDEEDDDESDDNVFAEYDDDKGVVFYPPVYAQRYAAVSDCLMDERWCGKLEKVVDLGYHDMSFIKYLKDVPGIRHILGVDLESIPLRCSSDLLGCDNYTTKRENPLRVTLFQGNAADPDYRLIGCDAVVAIEMIEHMLPHDLERLIHTVFGFIKPQVAIFTTPNGDFNVLFKALEKNGLRRLDHMFEWSREQFHDWCSNIVARYPEYTVSCKGIGPGPPDTLHLGCCSQLAMFVAKDYTKQPDLDLNSLALVAKTSSPNDLSHIIGSWESPDSTIENNIMLYAPPSIESYPELMYEEPSCMTIALASPSSSVDPMEYRDKTFQCNLDSEIGKSFLMFDDEVFYNVLVPRRKKYCRVYEIEDVASRLNCSTFLVKKFSKATQSLMAKNKIDSFAHTREIVNEIRHLTKMLNFNKQRTDRDFDGTWCNINWGVNAPYWNQYYKIVRDYSYPFEAKTDESRILDLIAEEINRLIDTEYDEDIGSDMQKLEIPINELMQVVEHITTDVDTVKELLQWNGYEVVDGLVIHSRMIVDNVSEGSQEEDWQEDTISDWDTTEVRSTSVSDGSTIVPDYYGLRLRRAIDQKVRKLRTLLTADRDITTELDRVVCRLMKLALCTSKERKNPPPISWMQCKLFDLLTLTEKSVERRILQGYSLKAIEYHKDIISHEEIKKDPTGDLIVSKYENLNLPPDSKIYNINGDSQLYDDSESDYYNNISIASNELKDEVLEYENKTIEEGHNNDSMMKDLKDLNDTHNIELLVEESGLLENCNVDLVPYPSCKSISLISSEGSTCSTSNGAGKKLENPKNNTGISPYKKYKINGLGAIKMQTKTFQKKRSNGTFEINHKSSRTKINKKVSYRRSSYINILKYDSFECKKYKFKERKKQIEDHQIYQSTPSRPIPGSLIELCNLQTNKNIEKNNSTISNSNRNEICQQNNDIAATEKFMFIGIVTEDGEETIAMRRNIGISSDLDFDILENEDVIETVTNLSKDNSYCELKIETENVQSRTIFLYDLDEPSTSKGIRHLGTDVQCGPDVTIACPMLSQTTSFSKMPKLFTTGIKIEEPSTDITSNKITCDFGTCTEIGNKIVMEGRKSIGIKIKESIHDITESFTMTQLIKAKSIPTSAELTTFDSRNETKLLKSVCSAVKVEDSGSEFCGSLSSYAKSTTRLGISSKNNSDFRIQSESNEENIIVKLSQLSCDRTNLVCGGIHVHSFKERQVSEDVVYQGEWQRNRHLPKRNHRKNLPLPKRQKLNLKDTSKLNEIKKNPKTMVSVTNHKSTIKSQEPLNKTVQNNKMYLKNPVKIIKNNTGNVKKVASKVTVSSHISKNFKTIYTKTRTSVNNIETTVKKEEECKKIKKIKNYLPLYLRRKIQSSIKQNSVQNNSENEANKPETIILKETLFSTGHTREDTKDLIKMPEKTILTDINYMIFRNEIQAENDSNTRLPLATGMIINDNLDRSHSPSSQHSSTCSSPNSVATVRAVSTRNRITSNRTNSTSSERSSSGILESEKTIAKNKKFSRRGKSNKKPQILSTKQCDNKENVPDSSQNAIAPNSDTGKSAKSVFLGRTKSVFMAQITSDTSTIPLSSTAISKSKMQSLTKSIKLPLINTHSTDDEICEPSPSSAIPEASLDENLKNNDINDYSATNVPDNNSFKYEMQIEPSSNNSFDNDSCSIPNEVDDESSNNNQSIDNTKSCLITAIRKLIENKLNIPDNSYDRNDSDSETVILSRDENYVNKCNDQFSPTCNDTATKNYMISDNCGSGSDMDYSHIHCPSTVDENIAVTNYAGLKSPDTQSDATSLKSFASMSTSKFSEYYLADNEFESTIPQNDTLNTDSIQDIYERKELNTLPNIGGVLAIQAFSGFSVNEPITGDQPDFVNFIDSETGSFALQSARQAASEEIFVSGRSSDTYESCYVDEDAYVPNWLFNMISQQQSAEESEAEEINLPLQIPIVEPDFDINGNAMEPGIGVGAGAGDGRGIHSDHSQDSSGRGTSLSSSETSSGLQSEAISIDPSSFTAQMDNFREPLNIAAINGAPDRLEPFAVSNAGENNEVDTSNHQSRNPRNMINPVQIASDVDADVSSLETDAVDSDN